MFSGIIMLEHLLNEEADILRWIGKEAEQAAEIPVPELPLTLHERRRIENSVLEMSRGCRHLLDRFGHRIRYIPEKMARHLRKMAMRVDGIPPDYVNSDQELLLFRTKYIPELSRIVKEEIARIETYLEKRKRDTAANDADVRYAPG